MIASVRGRRAEMLTVALVALPVVLFVPPNAQRWYEQLRRDHHRNVENAQAVTPQLLLPYRDIRLEKLARASIPDHETFAIVPAGRWTRRANAGVLTYLTSWWQWQLAPRLLTDPERADWLVVLDPQREQQPATAREAVLTTNGNVVRR